jgi:hypothetical protein
LNSDLHGIYLIEQGGELRLREDADGMGGELVRPIPCGETFCHFSKSMTAASLKLGSGIA